MTAAKKILLKIFLFLFPLIVCFGFLEYKLRTQHFVSSYATKKYYLEQQLDSIETLVLGSSQTFNGIDVDCFTNKAFNFANVSQTLYYDKQLTLKYLPKLTKLKTVIINISYFSFFYEMCDITEHWREDFYLKYYDIDGFNKNKDALKKYSLITLYQPKHAVSLAFNNFIDEGAKAILHNGYQPKYKQETICDSIGLERVNIHNAENFANRKKQIEINLEDFVHQLRNKNINIVFVTTPVFTSYSKYCNKKILEQNSNFINTICSKYTCIYLNYFTDKRFIKNDFSDNDHLKNNGAKKLSILINDTLQKIKN